MLKLLKKLFRKKEPTSSCVAKARLSTVLNSDRTSITNGFLEKMKEEVLACICKYANIDPERLNFTITRADKNTHTILQATIPIFSYKEPLPEVLAS
jgi:cell division topological specificity factor